MTLRKKLLKLGSPAYVAVFAVSICVCALSSDAYADDPKAAAEAPRDSSPIRTSAQPPAKFFTINGVLAKLDRAEGRGKAAIRLASLKSWNTMIDARPPTQASARGAEPCGLFTFRSPALGISEVELLAKFPNELGPSGMDPWPAEARKYAMESRNPEYSAPQQAHARAHHGEA
jgi:hypothetical protein